MNRQQFSNPDERFLRRYEYEDAHVVVADLGVDDDNVDVDIVGDTAIVVIDTDARLSETEFELPGSDGEVEMNNGVLTITIRK